MEFGPFATSCHVTVRLFVSPDHLVAGRLHITGEEHHYLSRVRRLTTGNEVVLFDGDGRHAKATIAAIGRNETELSVEDPEQVPESIFRLSIAPALIKGDRMDTAITKMVELGVHHIAPMSTEHSVVRLQGDRAASRHKRFESLARAAARQSRSARQTSIGPITTLEKIVGSCQAELRLIPYTGANSIPLTEALPEAQPATACVLIGPEGGFTEAEANLAHKAGFIAVTLGPRILRAETACIAMASILAFRYGDASRR